MSVSSAKRLAVKVYQTEKCDRLTLDVPKGKRSEYKEKAASLGLSLSILIQNSVESYGTNHAGEVIQKPEAEKLTAEERRLLTAFAKLPKNAQTNLIKTLEALSPQKEE